MRLDAQSTSHSPAATPRTEATRMAEEWWANQKGLRQTLRTEVAVGQKEPDAQLDQWSITIRYEDETPR
jgi:hypothetical protein